MPTSSSQHVLYANKHRNSGLLTIVSLALVIAGTVGLVLLRKPLVEQSQDLRQDASVQQGLVSITTNPPSGGAFAANNASGSFLLNVNTNNTQIDGVQLTFYIEADNVTSPSVETFGTSGLSIVSQEVESTDFGYKVSLLALPALGQPFSSNTNQVFARVAFSAGAAGPFSVEFDTEDSIATAYQSDPSRDELTHIPQVNYSLFNPTASPSPSPTPTPGVSPSPSPSPTPVISPTPTPGTGGNTLRQCNESCSDSTQCGANNFCYNGKCRLVTNPQNTSCINQPDQGLSFSCNEYCSNTGECAGGYSCMNNRCRRADNPDDTLCRLPSNKTQQKVISSCNKSCSSNAGCAVNLRCYQGQCRLAVNPTSSSCSATTTSSAAKGGDESEQQSNDEATSSSTGSTTGGSTRPSATPKTSGSTESTQTEVVEEEGNLLTTLRNLLPLRLMASIALGIGLLILVLLLLSRMMRRKPSNSGPMTTTKPNQVSNAQYEKELQAKLNALKQQQAAPTPSMTTASVAPVVAPPSAMTRPPVPMPPLVSPATPVMPVEPRPVVNVPPMQSPVIQTRPAPVEPVASTPIVESPTEPVPETPVFNRSSSMMERIREKGINPPASDATSDQS